MGAIRQISCWYLSVIANLIDAIRGILALMTPQRLSPGSSRGLAICYKNILTVLEVIKRKSNRTWDVIQLFEKQKVEKKKKKTWNVEKTEKLVENGTQGIRPREARKRGFQKLFPRKWSESNFRAIYSYEFLGEVQNNGPGSERNEEVQSFAEIEETGDQEKGDLLHSRICYCAVN